MDDITETTFNIVKAETLKAMNKEQNKKNDFVNITERKLNNATKKALKYVPITKMSKAHKKVNVQIINKQYLDVLKDCDIDYLDNYYLN